MPGIAGGLRERAGRFRWEKQDKMSMLRAGDAHFYA